MSTVFRALGAVALIALGYALGHLASTGGTPVPPQRGAVLLPTPSRGEADPQLVKALMELDPLTRQSDTIRVLQTLPADRLPSVLASLDSVALAPGDVELALVGEWMASHDPEAAFEWAMSERYASHPWVLSAVLRAWAREDPQAAVQAFYRVRNASSMGSALSAVVLGWEEGGHPGIADFMRTFEQGATPQVAIEALVRRKLTRDGPEVTIRWAEALPADDPAVISRFKRNVMRRVASALADWDPQAAMDWATSFGEGPYGRGAYRRVAIRTARTDGKGTMDWLESLPAGAQRDGALQESYRTWMSFDRQGADAWIQQQADAPWLDPAHAMYAQSLMNTQGHQAALEWAEKIDGNLRKQRTATKIARGWYQRDPDAARAWVESAPDWLAEDSKQSILAPKRERPSRQRRREAAPAEQADSEPAPAADAAPEAEGGAPEVAPEQP